MRSKDNIWKYTSVTEWGEIVIVMEIYQQKGQMLYKQMLQVLLQ